MVSFSFLNAVDPTTIVFIVLLVVLIAALLIVPMFTNKKRAKQTEELHRSLQAGDLIKTVGGIIGTIKEIRQVSPVDREMVIETGDGDNKTTMVFDIQALYQVINRNNTVVPATEDAEDKPTEPVENAAPAVVAEAEQPVKVEEKTETVVTEPEKEEKVESTEEPAQEQAAVAEIAEEENKPKAVKPAQKKPVNSAKKTSGTKKTTTK
ncbi:preprotein translocase subunit YajC [Anaerocaecibacter muris]|uniref:preprotein translocase subunit YajC n=1 Tax=Anaerocaecibacter muris TaxID=2941513 RepID=UPI003F694744